ncbi:MAG: hypothetical protein QM820_61895 [Minicystis sp.]
MIYYVVTRRHRYTMAEYLESWGQALAPQVRVVPYGALPANRDLPAGTYVFSDLERLTPLQAPMVNALCDQLSRAPGTRILNHPARSLRRRGLLNRLHERGQNRFNAHPPAEPGAPWRYPVFVREENDHTGSLTGLIHDAPTLKQALLILTMEGFDPRDLLVVEFCDTADKGGIYRKYSAFRIGDRIVPRHVLFSKSWMLKDVDLLEPHQIAELKDYVRENPHEQEILALFDEANIEYGRIDYALLDGAIQVWEINTNPLIARRPDAYPAFTHRFHEAFTITFNEAFAALDTTAPAGARIPISWGAGPGFET